MICSIQVIDKNGLSMVMRVSGTDWLSPYGFLPVHQGQIAVSHGDLICYVNTSAGPAPVLTLREFISRSNFVEGFGTVHQPSNLVSESAHATPLATSDVWWG